MEIDKEFLEKLVSSAPELRQEYQRYILWRAKLGAIISLAIFGVLGIATYVAYCCGFFSA